MSDLVIPEGKQLVSKEKLAQLVRERQELKEMLAHSLSLYGIVWDLIGNRFPTDITSGIKTVNRVVKKVTSGEFPKEKVEFHLEGLRTLAPNHLTEEQIKLIQVFEDGK
jgi:hypothetical protein